MTLEFEVEYSKEGRCTKTFSTHDYARYSHPYLYVLFYDFSVLYGDNSSYGELLEAKVSPFLETLSCPRMSPGMQESSYTRGGGAEFSLRKTFVVHWLQLKMSRYQLKFVLQFCLK